MFKVYVSVQSLFYLFWVWALDCSSQIHISVDRNYGIVDIFYYVKLYGVGFCAIRYQGPNLFKLYVPIATKSYSTLLCRKGAFFLESRF